MLQLPPRAARASSLALLLASNVVPVVGVLALDWSVVTTVLVYFAETAVIGVYTALRILLARGGSAIGRIALTGFFTVHYGMFVAIQTVVFLGFADAHTDPRLYTRELTLATATFAISHGWSFLVHYLGRERERSDPDAEMKAPYGRVVAQQFAVIGGGFFLILTDLAAGYVLVLVAAKTVLDARAHLRAHRDEPARQAAASTDPTA